MEVLKYGMLFILAYVLFVQGQIKISKNKRDALALAAILLFIVFILKDITLAIIFTSILYILMNKVIVEENFNTKNEPKTKSKSPLPKPNKDSKEKAKTDSKKTSPVKKVAVSEHCTKRNLDEEFMKKYTKNFKLDDIQTNVFDKYNYEVFYNELGENSLDIQGIHNHEVSGFEKL